MCFHIQKTLRVIPVLAFAVLLCGCGSRLLSEREIARAVLLEQTTQGYQAVLLINDQQSEESPAYKVAQATAETAAEAWARAERTLPGELFYGLTDLLVLPSDCNWNTASEIVRLAEQTIRPAPQVNVCLMDRSSQGESLADHAAEWYEKVRTLQKEFALRTGMQTIFSDPEGCSLPVLQQEGYGFAFLERDGETFRCHNDLQSQLAAVLCGSAGKMNGMFSCDGQMLEFRADVRIAVQPQTPDSIRVFLTFQSEQLDLLSAQDSSAQTLRAMLDKAIQMEFHSLMARIGQEQSDPFDLQFWTENRFGPADDNLDVQLSIFHDSVPA